MEAVPAAVRQLRALRALAGYVFGLGAGLAAFLITTLLLGLVIGRALGLNIVWIPEATRIVLIWGVALGAISASCSREHFRLEMFGSSNENRPGIFDILRTSAAILLFGYVALGGLPTIASAAMQAFAAIPLSYSVMRFAVVAGIGTMALVECLILAEQLLLFGRRFTSPGASR
jgi:TRAP-type C4-dicarboxylate transport system permease small subunit